jgi:hypothetical protein
MSASGAPFGSGAMSELSPQCALKRTSGLAESRLMGPPSNPQSSRRRIGDRSRRL